MERRQRSIDRGPINRRPWKVGGGWVGRRPIGTGSSLCVCVCVCVCVCGTGQIKRENDKRSMNAKPVTNRSMIDSKKQKKNIL